MYPMGIIIAPGRARQGLSDFRLQIINKVYSYVIVMILLLSVGCDRGQVDVNNTWQQAEVREIKTPSEECVVGEMPADRLLRVFLSEERDV